MRQEIKKEVCKNCKKEVSLTHHSFDGVAADGGPLIKCHPTPHGEPTFVLKFVLDARAAKRQMLAEIERLEKKLVLDENAITNTLRGEFDAKVKDEATKLAAADLAELEANFQKIVDDGEKTRIQLDASFEAQMLDKKALLAEISTQRDMLIVEKAVLAQKSFDLQLQVDELTEAHSNLTVRHKGLKDRSLDIVRMLISVGTRVVVLEEKTGVIPRVDPKRIFSMIMGEEYEEEVIPVSDLSNDPTPVPPPATKADVETSAKETTIGSVNAARKVTSAVGRDVPKNGCMIVDAPKEVAALAMVVENHASPPQSAAVVGLDDPEPESDPYASADDGYDGHDHQVDDDDVVDQEGSSSDEECRVCDNIAKQAYTFTKKDGSKEQLTACDSTVHAADLLEYLTEHDASAPQSADEVIKLFTPIR